MRRFIARLWIFFAAAVPAFGQLLPPADWAAHAAFMDALFEESRKKGIDSGLLK